MGLVLVDGFSRLKDFFNYHKVLEDECITMAAFALEEKAFELYQWMENNNRLSTWVAFNKAIEEHFSPSKI